MDVLLTRHEVADALQIKPRTLQLWMSRPGFPRPVKVIGNKRFWLAHDIAEYRRRVLR